MGDPDGDRDRDSDCDCATTYPPTQLWRGLRRGGCRYVTPWDRGKGPQTQGDTGLSDTSLEGWWLLWCPQGDTQGDPSAHS